jgi:ABC-type branched-subunit amino acid transport system permease subunit
MSYPNLLHHGSAVRTLARRPTRPERVGHTVPEWAVVSAGLSPILLAGAWLVAGARQPSSYSPVHQTVSVLAGQAATDRWIVTAALFVVGACHFVTAAGLTGLRRSARILLAVAGASGIGIATSPEPAHGSTPQHLAWTALGAVTIAVWPAFVAQRRSPRPTILSGYGCATVTAVFLALLGWLVFETRWGGALGLAERTCLSAETTWPFIVAVALRRTTVRAPRAGD